MVSQDGGGGQRTTGAGVGNIGNSASDLLPLPLPRVHSSRREATSSPGAGRRMPMWGIGTLVPSLGCMVPPPPGPCGTRIPHQEAQESWALWTQSFPAAPSSFELPSSGLLRCKSRTIEGRAWRQSDVRRGPATQLKPQLHSHLLPGPPGLHPDSYHHHAFGGN